MRSLLTKIAERGLPFLQTVSVQCVSLMTSDTSLLSFGSKRWASDRRLTDCATERKQPAAGGDHERRNERRNLRWSALLRNRTQCSGPTADESVLSGCQQAVKTNRVVTQSLFSVEIYKGRPAARSGLFRVITYPWLTPHRYASWITRAAASWYQRISRKLCNHRAMKERPYRGKFRPIPDATRRQAQQICPVEARQR